MRASQVALVVKDLPANAGGVKDKIPWRVAWQPTPVFLLGESHGQYGPWGLKESDMTERLLLHLDIGGFPSGSDGKASRSKYFTSLAAPYMEKEMETHSSTLAWRTPWTEGPNGL